MSNVFDVRTFTAAGVQDKWAHGVRPTFTDELFETNGVLQVEVERALPAAEWLAHGTEVALFMNGRELPDSRAILSETADAETDARDVMGSGRSIKWSGRTLMSQLESATIYPAGWPDDVEGGHTFGTATPGEIMRTLVLRAQSRGALMSPKIEMDFTAAADSAGVPWEKALVGLGFDAGVTLKTALDAIMRLGAGEPRMVGRTLQLFNPEGIGVDRTEGPDPIVLRRSQQVVEQPRNESSQGIANVYLVRGDDGVVFERVDEASVARWGRREAHLSQQNMSEGTLTVLADAALARTSGLRGEYSAKVVDRPGTPQPFSDFQKGDWVWLEQDGRLARYRVRQMSATPDESSRLTESGVTLNDKFAELDMLMAKRIEGVTGAGSQETVQPIDPDRTPRYNPKPPEGIGGTSYTYWDNNRYRVSVVLQWLAVTERTNGHALDSISQYDVYHCRAALNDLGKWERIGNWQKATEVDGLQATLDGYEPDSSHWFTVVAEDQYGKRSEYGQPFLMHMTRDEEPPPVPSRLTAEYQMGWPIIGWDGRDEDGNLMVLGDFDGIEVARVVGDGHDVKVILRDASTYVPHDLTLNEPATFVARSFDHAEPRNYSDWSLPLSVMPRPLVEEDLIGSVIDDWQEAVDDRIRDIVDNVIPGSAGAVQGMLEALIAQIEKRGGTTWVQDTPPPAGTFYRWTGDPYASASEKVVDGEVVARNDVPPVSSAEWSPIRCVITDHDGYVTLTNNDPDLRGGQTRATPATSRHRIPIGTNRTFWQSAEFRVPAGSGISTTLRGQTSTESGNYSGLTVLSGSVPDDGEWHKVSVESPEVPEGTAQYLVGVANAGTLPEQGVSWDVRNVSNLPPDVPFFLGDSLDDRANDLWVNTAEGNKPYTWDPETKDWVEVADERIADLVNRLDSVVSEYAVEYAVGTSETVPPTSGWSTETPTRTPGTFVWYRAVITYGDGHQTTSEPALLTGNTGRPGDPGAPAPVVTLTSSAHALTLPQDATVTVPATAVVNGTAEHTTIDAWDYSVNGGSFVAAAPAGVSRSGNTVTVTGSSMTARSITIRARNTVRGVGDTLTVAKVVDGADGEDGSPGAPGEPGAPGDPGAPGKDAYTVLLSNEAHTFPGSKTAALPGSTTSRVTAYKGASLATATIGTITGQVNGLTTSVSGQTITISVTAALTATGGVLSVPVTVDGKTFTKEIAWTVAREGADGLSARTISIEASTQVLAVGVVGSGTNPTTAVLTGRPVNTTISSWTYSTNGGAFVSALPAGVTRSDNVVTITGSSMTARTIAVRMADTSGTSDTVTVAKIADGAPGTPGSPGTPGQDSYTVLLTNEAHTFPGSTSAALAGSATSMVLSYKGVSPIAATVGTITGQVNGLTASVTGNGTTSPVITVTVTTALTALAGVLTVPITVGGQTFTRTISWTVSRAGTPGTPGVSITKVTPYFAVVGDGLPAPEKPTTNPPGVLSPWRSTEPAFQPDTDLYRTECIEFSNATYSYTDVTRVASYEGIKQVRTIAITADKRVQAGVGMPSLADGEGAPEGAIYWEYGGDPQSLMKVWRWTGSEWVEAPLNREVIPLIDIGSGTFGDLTGLRLMAGTVLTRALAIGDFENLFRDQTFDNNYGPLWTKDGDGITKAGTGSQHGNYYMDTAFAVKPGDKIVGGYTDERSGDDIGGGKGGTGAAVGTSTIHMMRRRASTGAWTYLGRLAQADEAGEVVSAQPVEVPADTDQIRLGFYTEASMPATTQVRISDVWVRKQTGTVLIEDGAVTADKVVVNGELWAKLAQFVEVVAGMIEAEAIEAQHLSAVIALLTRVVSGDPEGAAAEMDRHGFKVYAQDDQTGARYEVGSFGTASGDTLAVRGPDGRVAGGIDSDGFVTGTGASIGSDPNVMGRMLFGAFGDPTGTDDSWLMDLPQGVVSAGALQANRVTPLNSTVGYGDISFEAAPMRNYMIAQSSGAWRLSNVGSNAAIAFLHSWTFDGSQPRLGAGTMVRGSKYMQVTAPTVIGFDWTMFHEMWPGWDPIANSHSLRMPSGVPLRMLTAVETTRCQIESLSQVFQSWVRVLDMGRYVESSTNENDGGVTASPTRQIYRTYWEANTHRTWNNLGQEGHAPTAAQLQHGRTSYSPQYGLRSSVALFTAANGRKAIQTYPGHHNTSMTAALSGRTLRKAWVQLWCTETNHNRQALLQLSSYPGTSLPSSSPTTVQQVSARVSAGSWVTVEVPTTWFDTSGKRGILTRSSSTAIDRFARYAGSGDTNGRRPRVVLEYQ